jgi:hydroxymethylglutaryl-CoA lyase
MTDVKICEMSPRDGLQYLGGPDAVAAGRIVPLEARVRLIRALVEAGLRHIEVASFVSPKGTPQMAVSDELGAALDPAMAPGLELSGLVPNDRGYERFAATRLNVVAVFPSANEAHCRQNFHGRGVDEVLAWAGAVASRARADGKRLRAHVSAAFQDIASATVPSDVGTVARVCETVLDDFGCEYLTLADTNGTTNPARVAEILEAVGNEVGGLDRVGVHLHDRYGTGIANAYAAWEKGVRIFDASLGGVGGSVAASIVAGNEGRHMVGNIATESLVKLFDGLGVDTGIDVDGLARNAGAILAEICAAAGDFAPPSGMLRDALGYGVRWSRTPGPAPA